MYIFLIIAFITSLITFAVTVVVGIICFTEMREDLVLVILRPQHNNTIIKLTATANRH